MKTEISSVAVLPFLNNSGTPESEFLSDGLSEGLLDSLSQLPDLTVIARTSTVQFRGSDVDVRKVARLLNVRAVVTGRVSQRGQALRLSVELVDGAGGNQMWGHQYSCDISDLGRLQAEMSNDIAHQIRSNLTGNDTSNFAVGRSVRREAYELLLRGRYQMRLYRPESTSKAISYFEQAIAIDPRYALAEVELANVYRRMGSAGILNHREALPLAEAAGRQASLGSSEEHGRSARCACRHQERSMGLEGR